MNDAGKTYFAPQLYIRNGVKNIDFYSRAFGAVELRRWSNEDGTIHVAELSIHGALFHLHEQGTGSDTFDPDRYNGTTTLIGLFVPDVHAIMEKAMAAGAIEIEAVQDYDYGYRQGQLKDPFGHHWLIQMKLSESHLQQL
jgi:PhnB protein